MSQRKGFIFRMVWGVMMVIIYFGMAYLLTLTNMFKDVLPAALRIAFGTILALYGVYRGYRVLKNGL